MDRNTNEYQYDKTKNEGDIMMFEIHLLFIHSVLGAQSCRQEEIIHLKRHTHWYHQQNKALFLF